MGDSQPWQAYEVQVYADNKKGKSLVVPEIIEGRTGEGDPGVTPQNFRVRNITSTTADFVWDTVQRNKVQGNFTGYKITFWYDDEDESGILTGNAGEAQTYRRRRQLYLTRVRRNLDSSSALNQKSVVFSPQVSFGTISGFKPNSMNYAIISVLNGQNEGAPSEIISFRTNEGGKKKEVTAIYGFQFFNCSTYAGEKSSRVFNE